MKRKNNDVSLFQYLNYMRIKAKGFNKFIPLIFLSSLVFSLISILIALISKNLIDSLLTLEVTSVYKVIFISISAYLLGTVLGFFTSYLQKYIVDKLKMKMQLSFYDNMQRAEFLFLLNLSSSDIYYRMIFDITTIVDYYLNLLINIPIKILMFIVAITIMSWWSITLTFTILGFILLQFIIMNAFKKPIKRITEKVLNSDQTLIANINEDILTNEICRSLSLEEERKEHIEDELDKNRKKHLSSAKLNILYSSTLNFTGQIINVCLLLIGVLLVSQQKLTLGALMGLSILSGYLYQPINEVFNAFITFQTTKISFRRYKEFYDKIDRKRENCFSSFNSGDLFVKNLSYDYDTKNLFVDFSCVIKCGKITLLRGKNGSGKTTLLRFLTRYINDYRGNIFIDETDIRDINFDEYRKNVIALGSDPVLLNGSLRYNLSMGLNIDNDEIYQIINTCGLNDVFEK